MDHYLIELLRYRVFNGNKVSDEFMAKALIEMVTVQWEIWSHHHEDALRHRYKHLRKQHNDTKVLLEHSGLS